MFLEQVPNRKMRKDDGTGELVQPLYDSYII